MRLRFLLTATVLATLAGLAPARARAEASVSVQVTVAGMAVGGIAWALSIGWSSQFLPLAPAPLATTDESAEFEEPAGAAPLLYLPLLVLPLP